MLCRPERSKFRHLLTQDEDNIVPYGFIAAPQSGMILTREASLLYRPTVSIAFQNRPWIYLQYMNDVRLSSVDLVFIGLAEEDEGGFYLRYVWLCMVIGQSTN